MADLMQNQQLKNLIRGSGVVLASLFGLSACNSTGQYTQQYSAARQQQQGVTQDAASAQALAARFAQAFNQMGQPSFISAVDQLYADSLYINDTLSVHYQKGSVLENFKAMNKRIQRAQVTIIDVTTAKDVAYVHWKMRFDLKLLGQVKVIESHGISELKQNAAGQIIFQHDFWDPANGLYRALPYAGGLYRWLTPFKTS